jgi:replication-associated recombination protein RarA
MHVPGCGCPGRFHSRDRYVLSGAGAQMAPATFDALVGQEHVLQALRHALDSDRLHHAYLFTGTRGVGKTTIARILARCA